MATTDHSASGDHDTNPPVYPDKQLDVSEKIDMDRINSITAARNAVREVRETAFMHVLRGDVDPKKADLAFRDALESYLLEVKQYRTIDDTAESYWVGPKDQIIGAVMVDPPKNEHFDECEPQPAAVIEGLNDILDSPRFFEHTFEQTRHPRHGGPITETETVTATLPRHLLDTALWWANQYVNHIGLDLRLEDTVDADAQPY